MTFLHESEIECALLLWHGAKSSDVLRESIGSSFQPDAVVSILHSVSKRNITLKNHNNKIEAIVGLCRLLSFILLDERRLKVLLNKQNTVTEEEKEEKEEEDIQQTLESFNLFDYIITILLNLIRSINSHKNNNSLCKEILFDANFYLFNKMYDAINEQEIRIKLLEFGMETANSVIQHST